MAKIYITKVLNILGGFKDQTELDSALESFESGLTPLQAVNKILNNR